MTPVVCLITDRARAAGGADGTVACVTWAARAGVQLVQVREQRLDVMYELADVLERTGEPARALDVFADLDFDAASYRDVPERISALRRGMGEGRAT